MNDFEERLSTLLNEQVDHDLSRHDVAMSAPTRPDVRRHRWRRTGWAPLLAAACVAVVAAGTYGATQLADAPAPPAQHPPVTGSPSSTVPTTAPPTVSHNTSTASTPHSTPRSQPAAIATTTECAASQLSVTIDPRHIPGNGTPGIDGRLVHAVLVDFQNTSARSCTLRGYPGAAILGSDGSQLQQAQRTTADPYGRTQVSTVTLRPQRFAAAYIVGQNSNQSGNCGGSFPHLLVTPPNTFSSTTLPAGWSKCYTFLVHPVQALPDAP